MCVLLIATRFMVGLTVGIPAALLVINRRLYKIASRTQVITTKNERLRAVYVDLAIGLSIPFLQMILRESTRIALHSLSDRCSFRDHC
jgi:pheromone a factor receptor